MSLIVSVVTIVLVRAEPSRGKGVGVRLGVGQEAVRRLAVVPMAGEVEDAAVVEDIHQTVDVVGIDDQVVEVEFVGRGSVQFQRGDRQKKQTLVSEGEGGVHTRERGHFL